MDEKPPVTQEAVSEALGVLSLSVSNPDDTERAQEVLKKATANQISHGRAMLADSESYGGEKSTGTYGQHQTQATGGIVDELGYMHGGMPHGKREPIKYAAGGAVRGKRFVGTF